MDELYTYQIEVQGRVVEDELNVSGPIEIAVVSIRADSTRFSILTDQSGLIGMLRYLHTHGLIFLTIQKER